MDLHSWKYLCFSLGEHLLICVYVATYSYCIVFKIHEPSSAKVLNKLKNTFLKVVIIFNCKYTYWCIVTTAQSFVAVQHQEEKGRVEIRD